MSAHWWELWSPGLQAAGGIVELIGAIIISYEWWKGSQEAKAVAKGKSSLATVGVVQTGDGIKIKLDENNPVSDINKTLRTHEALLELMELSKKSGVSPDIAGKHITDYAEAKMLLRHLSTHRYLYVVGFLLVIFGVILQVAANGIAWAAAKGLFS